MKSASLAVKMCRWLSTAIEDDRLGIPFSFDIILKSSHLAIVKFIFRSFLFHA